jgi:hypothetical protein
VEREEDSEEGGSTSLDPEENAPLADPRPGFDTRFLNGLWVRTLATLAKHVTAVAIPLGILVAGGLADSFISYRAWFLALPIGALKGLGWGYYLGVTARSVRGGVERGRVLVMVLLALVMTLTAWSFFLGLLVAFTLVFLPILDFAAYDPSPERFLRQTVLLLRKSGMTWFATQGAVMLGTALVMLTVDALGSALLGPIFGGLLAAVILAPIAHVWAVSRAVWCHRWI